MRTNLQVWKEELREIEARNFSWFLDWTRAAVLRSCIRAEEIDEENRFWRRVSGNQGKP
jgi:hypothetical protein